MLWTFLFLYVMGFIFCFIVHMYMDLWFNGREAAERIGTNHQVLFTVEITFQFHDYWPMIEVTDRRVKYAVFPPFILVVEEME